MDAISLWTVLIHGWRDAKYVDYANSNLLNDTAANLHWVTPSFNLWSRERKDGANTLESIAPGATERRSRSCCNVCQKTHNTCTTAARIYVLLASADDCIEKVAKQMSTIARNDLYHQNVFHIVNMSVPFRSTSPKPLPGHLPPLASFPSRKVTLPASRSLSLLEAIV